MRAPGREWLCGAAVALGVSLAAAASACPVCDSETGGLVRAGIFDAAFGVTLLQVIAPLPVLVAVIARLHFGKGARG